MEENHVALLAFFWPEWCFYCPSGEFASVYPACWKAPYQCQFLWRAPICHLVPWTWHTCSFAWWIMHPLFNWPISHNGAYPLGLFPFWWCPKPSPSSKVVGGSAGLGQVRDQRQAKIRERATAANRSRIHEDQADTAALGFAGAVAGSDPATF